MYILDLLDLFMHENRPLYAYLSTLFPNLSYGICGAHGISTAGWHFLGRLPLKRFAVDFLQKGRPPKALKSAGFRAFGFLTVFFSTDAAALCAANLQTNGLCPDDPSCFEPLSHTGERENLSRGSVRCFRIRFFR